LAVSAILSDGIVHLHAISLLCVTTADHHRAYPQMPATPSRLILASQSPRRKELLRDAGFEFEVVVPSDSAECGICSQETAPEMVARLAQQKGADVAARIDQGLIIACDTVAECCGQILGKPQHREHAQELLELLRGREHRVYSGLCLWERPSDATQVIVEVTHLKMDNISDEQLQEYLDSDLWEGKAGAFGYQDRQGWLEIVEGSEANVVGLPIERLVQLLQ
jgi:septum formation protein